MILLGTKPRHSWALGELLAFIQEKPLPVRMQFATLILPDGYVLSSPEREEQIMRMAAILDAQNSRPTQYGCSAARPQDRSLV